MLINYGLTTAAPKLFKGRWHRSRRPRVRSTGDYSLIRAHRMTVVHSGIYRWAVNHTAHRRSREKRALRVRTRSTRADLHAGRPGRARGAALGFVDIGRAEKGLASARRPRRLAFTAATRPRGRSDEKARQCRSRESRVTRRVVVQIISLVNIRRTKRAARQAGHS